MESCCIKELIVQEELSKGIMGEGLTEPTRILVSAIAVYQVAAKSVRGLLPKQAKAKGKAKAKAKALAIANE